jgi:hypothetical protein
MQLALRLIAFVSFIVAIVWVFQVGAFEPEPILAFLGGLTSLALSFTNEKKESGETLDQRNRRIMLDHVENFWVKGILEKSLHGAALLELGIKEDPTAVNYPWTIKKESTNETLPAGKSMLEIFQEIGLGRSLLILGAPGSGKTTMLLELARQMNESARNDETEPIPVVFNLASWAEGQTIADWLVEQLNIFYYVPKRTAPAWVNENKMLLLLDGLDEVKQESRAKCVDAINQFNKVHGLTAIAICSRMEEYKAIKTKLSLVGAVALQPLTSKQVTAYFDKIGKGLEGVKQLIKKDKALQELTETPLMLSIMTLAYKQVKDDEVLASEIIEEPREHLFNTYIARMFERTTRRANSPFSKQQTLHYLKWLAQMMIKHNITAYQIEAMQPFWLEEVSHYHLYQLRIKLIVGLLFGTVGGMLIAVIVGTVGGMLIGEIFGVLGGMLIAVLSGLPVVDRSIIMVDRLRWSWKTFRSEKVILLLMGLLSTLLMGLGAWRLLGVPGGLVFGMLVGLIVGLLIGLSSEQIEETTRPGQRLKQTFFSTFLVVISVGLVFGLLFGLVGGLLVGLIFGLLFGLLGGLNYGTFNLFQHYILRFILMRHKFLPGQLVPFLEYAVDLIFLRRVGGSYIFIHRLLMEHFAEMEV